MKTINQYFMCVYYKTENKNKYQCDFLSKSYSTHKFYPPGRGMFRDLIKKVTFLKINKDIGCIKKCI